ncbi:MAG: thioredoxin family protein [Bacteroidota bacterium]
MRVESNPFARGTQAVDFDLIDTVSDQMISLQDVKGENGTVVMFICNHCPFVIHVNEELVRLANDYSSQGIGFVAINSNDVNYVPQDGPEFMKKHAKATGYPFPYLYDETQEVARAYDAACTPDLYVFDKELKSVYHGQLDDSRPGNTAPVNGWAVREVLDALIRGEEYSGEEKPSIGCNIKWKK